MNDHEQHWEPNDEDMDAAETMDIAEVVAPKAIAELMRLLAESKKQHNRTFYEERFKEQCRLLLPQIAARDEEKDREIERLKRELDEAVQLNHELIYGKETRDG